MTQHATITSSDQTARFLSSQNPAQVKRNLLASFTDVLLLPVTIVPKTVGAVGAVAGAAGSVAVQGIQMLNPQRWGGSMGRGLGVGLGIVTPNTGYTSDFKDGDTVFEIGPDEDDEKIEEADTNRCMTLSFF
jgi:recyclin-1